LSELGPLVCLKIGNTLLHQTMSGANNVNAVPGLDTSLKGEGGGGGLLIAGAGASSGENQADSTVPRSWDYTPGSATSPSRQFEGC
jgi:hypothetical protein